MTTFNMVDEDEIEVMGTEKIGCLSVPIEDQAAGILGVEIIEKTSGMYSTYGGDRLEANVFSLTNGKELIVLEDCKRFDAAVVPEDTLHITCDDESSAFSATHEIGLFGSLEFSEPSNARSIEFNTSEDEQKTFNNLVDAVEIARANAGSGEAYASVSVRRMPEPDGGHDWDVSFDEDYRMLIIGIDELHEMSDRDIADEIDSAWDPEWDDYAA